MYNLPEKVGLCRIGKTNRTVTGTDLYPMYERCKQEHEQLHGGHALVEQLGASVLILLQQGAAVLLARPSQSRTGAGARSPRGRPLVPHGLQEGAAAAARRPAVAQARLVVALLGRLQQHPVQCVEQLGLGDAQLVLVTCGGQRSRVNGERWLGR